MHNHQFTREEAAIIQPIDLTIIKLSLKTSGVKNGHGQPCNPRKLVEDFDAALREVLDAVRTGRPLPDEFVVPDFWHISLGDARVLPKGEGKVLWEAGGIGSKVGRTFYKVEAIESRNNHPGVVFYEPLAVPRYAETVE